MKFAKKGLTFVMIIATKKNVPKFWEEIHNFFLQKEIKSLKKNTSKIHWRILGKRLGP